MRASNIEPAWNGVSKFLHWLVALLIFTQLALGWLAAAWRLSPTKLELFVWHKSIGMVVLGLVVLRLAWRIATHAPPLPAGMPGWERAAARTSHVLLYVAMLGMPITGWVVSSASGVPFRVFRRIALPSIAPVDQHIADVASSVHLWLGLLLAALLLVHIGAALRHHFIRRDEVLIRMLPARRLPK